MYRSQCLAVSGVKRKGKANFEFPDSSLVGYGTVSTCKSDFPQWNFVYIIRIEQLKNHGILFTKIDNFYLLYQFLAISSDIQ